MAPTERRAPAKAAKDGVGNGKRKDGAAAGKASTSRKNGADKDADILVNANSGSWTDSLMVLSAVRWIATKVIELFSRGSAGQPGDKTSSASKKKSNVQEKETLPPKEAALQLLQEYKIPVLLIVIFVFTCAIIVLGEQVDVRRDSQKPEAMDDYYGTLGIPRDAETADVKRAYKTLAKRWHPDKNPNCTTCAETFAKIAIAYETLFDEEKRAAYDSSGDIATIELKSPRSVPLTRDNFDELVTFSNDVWIVQIFKPTDGHCAQFHPFWESQIQKYGHLVRFGRIDLTNDPGKWLPVKSRVLPTILKYGRHLATPEIFPITATHVYQQRLMKFVLTSFPNIGLPLHNDPHGLKRWLSSSSRLHKVLFAIPGRSEEERYKSHLVPRKIASRWSEIFEFRTAETAMLHKLSDERVPPEVRAALPIAGNATSQAAMILFPAGADSPPKASAIFDWPTGEDEMVLQLLSLAQLTAPTLSARSAELLCRSLAIRRVFCLVMLDPKDNGVKRALDELDDSKIQYTKEVADIRASGGEVTEDEDNFIVPAVRLFRQRRDWGLQSSIATCHAPKFGQVEKTLGGASALLLDFDTGRIAALRGLTSFRGIYPQIAYEDSLTWVDDAFHPFLSLPDCNEGIIEHMLRMLRTSPFWELCLQVLILLFLTEAVAKATVQQSLLWGTGACVLLLLTLMRSPPFLRLATSYMPGVLFAPTLPSSS